MGHTLAEFIKKKIYKNLHSGALVMPFHLNLLVYYICLNIIVIQHMHLFIVILRVKYNSDVSFITEFLNYVT